jgi:hypothetical protein
MATFSEHIKKGGKQNKVAEIISINPLIPSIEVLI